MNDPRRLLDEGATEFEREALESWDVEAPSAEAKARALLLAAGLVGSGVAGATASKIATGSTNATASIAPSAAALGTFTIAKWIAVFALGAALSALVLVALRSSRAREVTPSKAGLSPVASAVLRESPSAEPRLEQPAPPAPVEPSPAASAALPPKRTAIAGSAPIPRGTSRTLADEVAALDRANTALGSGDAIKALQLVDAYEQDYPHPSLVEEATLLRVRAMLNLGRRAEANELGGRFLDAHPTSAHGARLRQLLRANP